MSVKVIIPNKRYSPSPKYDTNRIKENRKSNQHPPHHQKTKPTLSPRKQPTTNRERHSSAQGRLSRSGFGLTNPIKIERSSECHEGVGEDRPWRIIE